MASRAVGSWSGVPTAPGVAAPGSKGRFAGGWRRDAGRVVASAVPLDPGGLAEIEKGRATRLETSRFAWWPAGGTRPSGGGRRRAPDAAALCRALRGPLLVRLLANAFACGSAICGGAKDAGSLAPHPLALVGARPGACIVIALRHGAAVGGRAGRCAGTRPPAMR
ncbi:hypothetical protein LNKW23_39530 [Paralimibaculum aggregatum]|uniref:Uncharacterized protein n=1 Tax=Paralimibaculum aggregatum TaxID=3036245 RepID=A0ABQ6LNF0_9RHOB|nr:hypothetical protein LNKW23_39530 [Limibaculum sp. NKW23]